MREALIEANNGSTKVDYRAIRDGKCVGLFALIEEILAATTATGLVGDEFFMNLVDYRDVAEGDSPIFYVGDNDLFVVSDVADGTQGIRRQRLGGVSETRIPTTMKMVRIYEELNRVLAGRVDFNDMIARVSTSFQRKLVGDIYALWTSATASQLGGATYYPAAGAYDEDALLELIAHVEAAAGGKPATIIGTKKALRPVIESVGSNVAKDEVHNLGYAANFYGTPVVAVPQRHKAGTSEFIMSDNTLTIVAGDEKPIKVVREGNPLVIMGDPMTNADLTQEFLYGEKYGMGIVLAGNNSGIGRYETT